MHPLLSRTARGATTSAIRDLLEQASRPGMINLAGGLPDPALFPTEQLAEIAAHLFGEEGADLLQYGLTAGAISLREHIVATTPCAASSDEIVVTTGSQQALHLIAQILLDPGDIVVVGDPEYLGALQAFQSRAVRFAPVSIDPDGIDVDAIEEMIDAGTRPKLVYVVSTFHNPTGATLHSDRRARLLELAGHHGFIVVFDDPYRELHTTHESPFEPDPHPMAIQLRSVSKVLAPGLRVGWMIAPTWLCEAVERAKQSADLHTSSLSQAIALGALTADWFPAHLGQIRASTAAKRDALCDALEARFGARLEFSRPAGGMFVWARFTDGTNTSRLLVDALDRGVAFVPGPAFAVDRSLDTHLRLSWSTTDPALLSEAVDRLAG